MPTAGFRACSAAAHVTAARDPTADKGRLEVRRGDPEVAPRVDGLDVREDAGARVSDQTGYVDQHPAVVQQGLVLDSLTQRQDPTVIIARQVEVAAVAEIGLTCFRADVYGALGEAVCRRHVGFLRVADVRLA